MAARFAWAERGALGGPSLRAAWSRALIVALLAGIGLALWPLVEGPFCSLFHAVAAATLSGHEFGHGGHVAVALEDAARTASVDRDASWDTRLLLRVDGLDEVHAISVNPRRLAYLPLTFLTALVLAAPLPWRRRARCLAVGWGVLWLVALSCVWTIVAWLFARVPGLVYALSPLERAALDFAYEGFVTPIANKLIVPLLLAGLLVLRKE